MSGRHNCWISKDSRDSRIKYCKVVRMSEESAKNLNTLSPKLIGDYQFKYLELKRTCLKQDSVSFLHKKYDKLIYF